MPVPRRAALSACALTAVLLATALLPAPRPARGVAEVADLDRTGTCPLLEAGAAARGIAPVGPDGVPWQEPFDDLNGNGRYDPPDPLDPTAPFDTYADTNLNGKWDGPFMAGYGHNSVYWTARGVHDPIWARAVVLRCGDVSVGMVALDVVGFFREEVLRVRDMVQDLGLTHVLVASTHTHDSIDTMGLWGPDDFTDGKDPRTQSHIRNQTEQALRAAFADLRTVRARFGAAEVRTDWGFTVTDGRDPFVIDKTILTGQFVDAATGQTVATVVNWSPHPETLAARDNLISSDFADALRRNVERGGGVVGGQPLQGLGGIAVYFSGAVGGLLSTLHTEVEREDGSLIQDPPGATQPVQAAVRYEKAARIGDIAAASALGSLQGQPLSELRSLRVQAREVYIPLDNLFLLALNTIGVFDHPLYAAPSVESPALGPLGVVVPAPYLRTEVDVVSLGPSPAPLAQVVTVPGELFPEVAIGGYLQPTDDCWRFNAEKAAHLESKNGVLGLERIAAANPQLPTEPVLRDHMRGQYKFLLGLGNDELGYIVPANDFTQATVLPVYGYGTDRCGDDDHYEETNSASSHLAPSIAQSLAALLDPSFVPSPEASQHVGFVDYDGRSHALPDTAQTRGATVDTTLDGGYEYGEDATVTVGKLNGLGVAWGFLDADGRDAGQSPPTNARGLWLESNGIRGYQPGGDAAVFADDPLLGDRCPTYCA